VPVLAATTRTHWSPKSVIATLPAASTVRPFGSLSVALVAGPPSPRCGAPEPPPAMV